MRNQYHYFLAALQFLTRIQVPAGFLFKPIYLEKASLYFPLVGNLVAVIGLLPYLVVNKYLGADLALVSYMLTTIWITGAFHEDGWADTCDAFGGGWSKEKILTIMKDSRLGTYGSIGLMGILLVKFLLLKELPGFTPPALNAGSNPLLNYGDFILLMLAAHGCSRLMAVTVIQQYDYVREEGDSKAKPLSKSKLSPAELLVCIGLAIWPLLLLSPWYLGCLIPMFMIRTNMARYFRKWIGGYTGDCLGAVQQVTEIIFYLTALVLWRYFI